MPGPDRHTSVLKRNCSEIIDLVYSSRSDLKDPPIEMQTTVGLLMALVSWKRGQEKLGMLQSV